MAKLPRAIGTPDEAAAAIIEQIRAYAKTVDNDPKTNSDRIRGAHHILDAARDSFDIALATANQLGPGKLSYRRIEVEIGVHKDAVKNHVLNGKDLMGGTT